MSTAKFRAGVVGAGYVSSYHLRALKALPFVEIVGVADSDPGKAGAMAAEAGTQAFPSLEAMAAAKPDVIHILTPPSSHCPLTLQALDMGCHVLVEKPMAESIEECDRMMARAAERGRVLSVNHSARFSPTLLRALEMVRAGAIGEVLAVDYLRSSGYPPPGAGPLTPPFRGGGYPYRDLGVHALYLIEAFLGEIEDVQTTFRATGNDPHLVFDEWRSAVRCRRGTGQVHLSWNTRPMLNELTVQGTGGILRIDLFFETMVVRRNTPVPKVAQIVFGNIFAALSHIRQVTVNTLRFATKRLLPSPDIHESVMAFYGALREGAPAPVPPEEGRRMVDWVERAAREADREKEAMLLPRLREPRPRVLVTGSGGFLGKALMKRLKETMPPGETIRVLARPRPQSLANDDPRVETVFGELGDGAAVERAMEGIDTVYHAGATMNGWWEDFERGTVQGTRNIVEACAKHKVRRLVHVSSLSVIGYAALGHDSKVDEKTAVEPRADERGFYAKSKLEAERIVEQAIAGGLPAVIVRPGQIFGPGAEKVAPFGTVAMGGRWVIMGDGSLALPLVYLDDVADGLVAAAARPEAVGATIQLVDPEIVTQREYAEAARGWYGEGSLAINYAPWWFLRLAAFGLETLGKILGRGVPLTAYRLDSIKGIRNFDITAAREKLGWSPRVGNREGLERTYGRAGQ